VRYLQDRGWDITGLEWSHETVRMVRSVWPDLRIVQGDAARSPFADRRFGALMSLGVVEHWPEGPAAPLADLFRVLKPGGVGIITVPCHNAVRRLKQRLWWDEALTLPRAIAARVVRGKSAHMNRLDRRYRYAVFPAYGPFFEYRFTPDEFRTALLRTGFEILEHGPHGEIDGIYHELNPLDLLVRFRDWTFFPSATGTKLNRILSRRPFFHCHMQLAVVRKPG
jgi:SAM-dependent methyltransferase